VLFPVMLCMLAREEEQAHDQEPQRRVGNHLRG
jgi:hypothetical protein